MILDPQSLIVFGALTFLGLSQASALPTSSASSAAQPNSTQSGPPPIPPLFGVNGPVLTDVIQRAQPLDDPRSDDPQAWYSASAAILANINSSGINSLFEGISSTGDIAIVKLHLLDGGVRQYNISYNDAFKNGTHVMGNERAGWPAALRSGIIQHRTPGVESFRLGQGLAKDCMKVLTGGEYRADQVETIDLWNIWNDFGPDKHPFVFRTVEQGNTKLAPEHDYGVVQVFKENKTIDLYDPNPEVGRRVYVWDEIVKDFDIVSWPDGLTQ